MWEGVCLWWQKSYLKKTKKVIFEQMYFYIFAALGRLAQLVQSTWFTPKGSGVRIPQRPHQLKSRCIASGFFVFNKGGSLF